MVRAVRVGCGSAYANDRVAPARALIREGELQYLALDCLAERTLAFAQARRRAGGQGFDENLQERISNLVMPCLDADVRFISNLGGADPLGAAEMTAEILQRAGVAARVAAVTGDDVLELVREQDPLLPALGARVSELGSAVVSANAYIGAAPIVEALDAGAQVVIGGRIADPSLYLAPLVYEHGWGESDLDAIAGGQLVGHLLECGTYLTGGYLADPPYVEVPDLWNLGYPAADVMRDGSARIWKLPGTGGRLDTLTCRAQALYEIGDPSAYLTPDVVLDLSDAHFAMNGDSVNVSGARGHAAPETLKVLVGVDEGFMAEAALTFGGDGALARAQLAADSFQRRYEADGHSAENVRIEYIGYDSALRRPPHKNASPVEVRLRAVGRFPTRTEAATMVRTFEWQLFGPAGAGGIRSSVEPLLGLHPVFVPRGRVPTNVELVST